MYIVNQDGTEVVPLHRAYTSYGEIMHFSPEDECAHHLATYPTQEEAQSRFNDMIYYLRREELVYKFPQPRQTTSEPPKP